MLLLLGSSERKETMGNVSWLILLSIYPDFCLERWNTR